MSASFGQAQLVFARIDTAELQRVRGNMPVASHARPDAYSSSGANAAVVGASPAARL